MNCTVCGNPLLFDRVAFHCSCGAFVHAYCWDEHVLQAHRPRFEMGTVSLDGQFQVRESETESPVSEAQESQEQGSEEQISEEESTEEQTTPLLG
ncbi:MAG: hypothetical protein IMY79_02810 [Chloroflexi bacterium]|nr:hypothetical protein [Chloroflexota bacterium]